MQTDIIGVALGIASLIIGTVVSFYFYRKSLRLKDPCWSIRSNNLIRGYSSKLSGLKIEYNEQNVENLTISKIIFWNDGAETIKRDDITTANPLRIIGTEQVELLEVRPLSSSSTSNCLKCELTEDKKSAPIEFEYLDQGQGAVIQVVHTGTTSKNINIIGDIKGVKKLRKKNVDIVKYLSIPTPLWFDKKLTSATRRKLQALYYLIISVFFLLSVVLIIYVSTNSFTWSIFELSNFESIFLAFNIFICTLYSSWFLYKAFKILQTGVPKGLEGFEEDF